MGNLIIKNNNTTKTYECKTTHTGKPYLQVNKNSYLDLTTNTTNGLHLQVKYCSDTANQTNTIIKTRTSQDKYTVTTGYEGYYYVTETKKITTGYQGKSTLSTNLIGTGVIRTIYDETLSLTSSYSSNTKLYYTTAKNSTTTSFLSGMSVPSEKYYYSIRFSGTEAKTYSSTNGITGTSTRTHTISGGQTEWAGNLTPTESQVMALGGAMSASPTEHGYAYRMTTYVSFVINESNNKPFITCQNTRLATSLFVPFGSFFGQGLLTYSSDKNTKTFISGTSTFSQSTTITKATANSFISLQPLSTTTTFRSSSYNISTNSNNLVNTTALTQSSSSLKNYTITDYIYDIYRPIISSTTSFSNSAQYVRTMGVTGKSSYTSYTANSGTTSSNWTYYSTTSNGTTITISNDVSPIKATIRGTNITYTGTAAYVSASGRARKTLSSKSSSSYTLTTSSSYPYLSDTGVQMYVGYSFLPVSARGSFATFSITPGTIRGTLTASCNSSRMFWSGAMSDTGGGSRLAITLQRFSSASAQTKQINSQIFNQTIYGTYMKSISSSTTNSNYTLNSKIITSTSSSSSSYSTTTTL